jgi:hypothetical protein
LKISYIYINSEIEKIALPMAKFYMKLITLPATASTNLLIEVLDYSTPKLIVTIKIM